MPSQFYEQRANRHCYSVLKACDGVRLTVQDAGEGITPQDMERLFDAFYTTKSEGMGMGLSVSRSIIERHRGRLWATPNDGPGATFSFSIPCEAEGFAGQHTLMKTRTHAEDVRSQHRQSGEDPTGSTSRISSASGRDPNRFRCLILPPPNVSHS
jgi:hypothetical protein